MSVQMLTELNTQSIKIIAIATGIKSLVVC